jgi:hypothetical protein
MAGRAPFRTDHGEIVHHVDREQFHSAGRCCPFDQLGPVPVRMVHQLGNNVVVRDDVSVAGHEKTGSDVGFCSRALLDDLDGRPWA